jgi:hypothetical protein
MTEVPKIVYDRLRAARSERALPQGIGPAQAHPDADLLAALAEQALSGPERDGVLEHLALCGNCREALALALPAADAPTETESETVRTAGSRAGAPAPHNLILAWPHLRWAALAAGVVVAAAVLLMHPGKLNQSKLPSINQQVAANLPPAPSPQIASPTPSSPSTEAAGTEARLKPELRLSKNLKAGEVVTPSLQAESGMQLAENKIADDKKDVKQADKLTAVPSTGARVLDYSAIPRSTEAVEVSAESPVVQTEAQTVVQAETGAEVSTENRQMARSEAPAIAKAKPAPQTETSQQQSTVSASVSQLPKQGRNMVSMAPLAAPSSPVGARAATWVITAGILQRSLDSGQSWQSALHTDHPLLCYASHDRDVWTGGQAGTLFRSADSGVTWVQVQPSIKAQQLTSDITHIDLHGRSEIVVFTTNNELWNSADGGKTWEKK